MACPGRMGEKSIQVRRVRKVREWMMLLRQTSIVGASFLKSVMGIIIEVAIRSLRWEVPMVLQQAIAKIKMTETIMMITPV
jgi:hypothetical protein